MSKKIQIRENIKTACAVIGLILLGVLIYTLSRPYARWHFKDNGKDEPYSQGVPLHEIQEFRYKRYFPMGSMLLGHPGFAANIPLPCDVHYYERPEDAEPVLTLEKGTTVSILSCPVPGNYGYGLVCWPDYQKGWRYGKPFTDVHAAYAPEITQKYYVKTAELDKVARAFYQKNKVFYEDRNSRYSSGKTIVRTIDYILYDAGAFCSPDLP